VQPLFLFCIQVTAFQSLPGSDAAAAGGLQGVSSDDLAGLDMQTQEALRASAAGALHHVILWRSKGVIVCAVSNCAACCGPANDGVDVWLWIGSLMMMTWLG
jgi:hypothetical protein